jgi:hypothetical protein
LHLRDTAFLGVGANGKLDFGKFDKVGLVKSIQFSSLEIEVVNFIVDL